MCAPQGITFTPRFDAMMVNMKPNETIARPARAGGIVVREQEETVIPGIPDGGLEVEGGFYGGGSKDSEGGTEGIVDWEREELRVEGRGAGRHSGRDPAGLVCQY